MANIVQSPQQVWIKPWFKERRVVHTAPDFVFLNAVLVRIQQAVLTLLQRQSNVEQSIGRKLVVVVQESDIVALRGCNAAIGVDGDAFASARLMPSDARFCSVT